MLKSKRPALLLIDIQNAFDNQEFFGGHRNNPSAEENCSRILSTWRQSGLPVFHIKHNSKNPKSPLAPGSDGNLIKKIVQPLKNEIVIEKSVNSAFIGTNLKECLDQINTSSVVIIGFTTNHCVSTTARMSGNYGYDTYVISDATATFNRKGIGGEIHDSELVHKMALADLNEEFATILDTAELLQYMKI